MMHVSFWILTWADQAYNRGIQARSTPKVFTETLDARKMCSDGLPGSCFTYYSYKEYIL